MQIAFIVPATFVMHDFWNAPDNDAASPDTINFMKVWPSRVC